MVPSPLADPLDLTSRLAPKPRTTSPNAELDPDGTVADIGAYSFDQSNVTGGSIKQEIDPYAVIRIPTLYEPLALRHLIEDLVAEDSAFNIGAMHGAILRPISVDQANSVSEGRSSLGVELSGVPGAITTLTLATDVRDLDMLPLVPKRPAWVPEPAPRVANSAVVLSVVVLDNRGKGFYAMPQPKLPVQFEEQNYYMQAQSKSPRYGSVGSSRVLRLVVGNDGRLHFPGEK